MFNKPDPIKKQQLILNKLLKKKENKFCADCKSAPPSWASMNLGVLVCIKCSGCHRELGTHISKIKSINLDTWPEEALENFKKIDNEIANKYWEHNLQNFDFNFLKNSRTILMEFIKNKYQYKNWINEKEIDPMTKIIQENSINNNNNNFNNINNNSITNFQNNGDSNINTISNINYYNNGNQYFNFQTQMKANSVNSNQNNFNFFNNNISSFNDNSKKEIQNQNPSMNFNWNYFNQNN